MARGISRSQCSDLHTGHMRLAYLVFLPVFKIVHTFFFPSENPGRCFHVHTNFPFQSLAKTRVYTPFHTRNAFRLAPGGCCSKTQQDRTSTLTPFFLSALPFRCGARLQCLRIKNPPSPRLWRSRSARALSYSSPPPHR